MKCTPPRPHTGLAALLACAVCLAAAAQSPVELNNAGTDAYNRGDFPRAIALLEKALAQAQDSPVVRRNLCNAYQSQANDLAKANDFKNAVRHAESAINVDPSNASPLVQAGSYYLRLDDVNTAIARLEAAITVKPGDLDAHELLGQAYYRDNDLSSARAQWDYVLGMDPKRPGLAERYEKAFREESVESDFGNWNSRHFRVSYPPDIPPVVRTRVMSILDRAYVEIGRSLGGVFPPPPIQVILYNSQQFSDATQLGEHVGAVYDGKIRTPLTDPAGNWLSEEEIQRRLTHEYVHVVVRNISGDQAPWWLNEGLAESLSKALDADAHRRLREIYQNGQNRSLGELEPPGVNRMAPEPLSRAYLQAHATVNLLWTRYGRGKIISLLQYLASGTPPEEAFRMVYRKTYAAVEREVAGTYQ